MLIRASFQNSSNSVEFSVIFLTLLDLLQIQPLKSKLFQSCLDITNLSSTYDNTIMLFDKIHFKEIMNHFRLI